ncbi:hypothetical protein HU200_007392 [Digitaria exilis]|uniref:Uncharacterized protein n=1 Tax=Digitaria exilis TaxID=1010633 RepID=A0A835KPZ3_9POAL|nr:hypothetical protein HU200_007392 [Digitaria exilis]CAB3450460.1 unnamed protein product [Digitaria exilis]
MGLCFSKKKPPATPAGGAKKPGKVAAAIATDDKGKKTAQQPKRAAKATGEAADAGKAAVFVVRAKDAAPTGGEEKKKRPGSHEPAAEKPLPVVVVPSAPVRTSSCTKDEVDAILIQCGRLSRSSSGTGRAASSETGGHRRRRSESKRSYDFDQDARSGGADEDWERQGAAVSRPSPHRGSPQRKRSGSRERTGGGGGSGSRRASRSPGRRTDGAAGSAAAAGSVGGERARQQQPGKMVSVPAREKGRAPSPAAAAASGKRCASPRSSSPARMVVGNENVVCGLVTGPTPALSRSSSRKAEQSPYRRNPMAELDENSLRNNSNHNAKPQKKSIENAIAATPKKKNTERGKESTVAPSCRSGMEKKTEITTEEDATVVAASETRAPSSKSANRTASVVAESLSQRQPVCRSRRASRDFDQNPGGSYTTTQLLEDIHSYHQQSTTSIAVPATTPATPSFSLPACVAKACSIVEAVADLNSTSSENRTYEYEPGFSADDKGSVNAGSVEPSAAATTARKHAQPAREFRAEAEPQESAGSNSVVSGQPWTPSWEPTSVESTERTWSTGDEVVEQSGSYGARCSPMNNRARQSKQWSSQMEPSGRSRVGSGNGNTLHRGRSAHRGSSSSVASGRSGVRVVSAAS